MKNFFTRILLTLPVFLLGISAVQAQYYYKDIYSNRQVASEFKILKSNDLKDVQVKSFESDGQPSQGFYCERRINHSFTQSQMISKSNITGQSVLTTDYNTDGYPVKTVEETPTTTNTTEFTYDSTHRLLSVTYTTRADQDSSGITETRQYLYKGPGNPVKMIRKRNQVVLSVIDFVKDSADNVIEEDVEGKSSLDKRYYYYYDSQNRLTDVVHYNELARRLLPDYMFEYNPQNQVSQMITTEEGSSNYFTWMYTYNDLHLRESEKCFAKDKSLLGNITYLYTP